MPKDEQRLVLVVVIPDGLDFNHSFSSGKKSLYSGKVIQYTDKNNYRNTDFNNYLYSKPNKGGCVIQETNSNFLNSGI